MKLKINGEDRSIKTTHSSEKLILILEELSINPKSVVVEVNGIIVQPQLWRQIDIFEGDILEIVTIVGGGS